MSDRTRNLIANCIAVAILVFTITVAAVSQRKRALEVERQNTTTDAAEGHRCGKGARCGCKAESCTMPCTDCCGVGGIGSCFTQPDPATAEVSSGR